MKVIFLRQAYRFIRKADKNLRTKIQKEVLLVQQNPKNREKLSGKLNGIYSHHFSHTGVQYRMVYKIVKNIIVIAIGTRENFYQKLQR